MTYKLYIGDRTFSSWSMRGWLMLEKFNLPFQTKIVGLYAGTYREEMAHLTPARTVPAMQTAGGHVLSDSLAMAETLVEENPDVALYPKDPAARALARNLIAEMHSGFMALREDCPNNINNVWTGFQPSDAVKADIARIEELWALARSRHGTSGPWLFGDYTIVDAFYAPVACRMTTYGLPISQDAQDYVDLHLADIPFRRWRAMGQTEVYDPFPYTSENPQQPWPGTRLAAKPIESGQPENDVCPYSGKSITHLLELDGRIFGFCNAFCRDKTVADPAAWPKFIALL